MYIVSIFITHVYIYGTYKRDSCYNKISKHKCIKYRKTLMHKHVSR